MEMISNYRAVTSFPTPTNADLTFQENLGSAVLYSYWSQRDLERTEKTTLLRTHTFDIQSGRVISYTGPQEIKNELWNKFSPSGKLRAVVRNEIDQKKEDKQYLEIFDCCRKLKTIDILAEEKHGKIVNNDGQFGSFEWSASEKQILYLAEKKKAKTSNFFGNKVTNTSEKQGSDMSNTDSDKIRQGDGFAYIENWGEQLTERVCPVICILDIDSISVKIIEILPFQSPGQVIWAPLDSGIVFCAWKHEPYKLGLKFCCQRECYLYYQDIEQGSAEVLSEKDYAVRFPRFSPDMRKLIYLDVPVGGAHNQCARLIMIDWATRTRKVVVDTVGNAIASKFPGIYTYNLERYVWFSDNVHLALSSNWRSVNAILIVNTDTGAIQHISNGIDNESKTAQVDGSFELLCVKKNVLVLVYSALNLPFHLVIANVSDPSNIKNILWIYPDGPQETLDWLSFTILTHKPSKERTHPKFECLDYESILCLPNKRVDGELPPLIVFSHGGPNSVFDTSFNIITAFFCKCGYAVVMVNYRGSLGFGQDSINSLIGNIGTQDVQDVKQALEDVIEKGVSSNQKIFKFGGSHGGFITTHFIGQYPNTFMAAASRNPVVNLTSMLSATDINDWVLVQAGLEFKPTSVADDKILPHLWSLSPMSYIDQVRTPILLMIGAEDRRVPPSQGFEYYKALKSRGIPVRCLVYPGNNHSLTNVDAEADSLINTVIWFNTYLS
ncbi:acylamino-acid-releasing enzyme-like isoform X2 [Physella acuta]|nr:acylamino-acid-releasing enzyme-like isoform X2 [Physella acuta]XP_059152245.1 acylamino-acid-releasing enzyme-like isoform X2 [Physella acuta]XP_059152246.1 acylamino-acid-releasing enzyme-like isoform X2 [Physella acuta]XP_059152247.1 acylamino-acid-releasing enzyme-like isoform X2 [Physella acuta]XP_059152248.1 acylamino-acid-releasing enzyme-like isoform X2 [Physella acuta]